ncbi:hypothetical protein EBZ80_00465 [bacterium]|nr:hypothetical protein [bacterium]
MDARDLIARYKAWPRRNRMLAVAVAGMAYPLFMWWSDVPPLESQLESVVREENEARGKYEKTRKEQNDLPKLEVEFKFVQDQLTKAKALLPEKIAMEDILQKTATIARETRISLNDFSPASELAVNGDYRYAEIPVALMLRGSFSNIMAFYDRIVHLAGNIRLRGLAFIPGAAGGGRGEGGTGARDLEAKVTMVLFRSTDNGQAPAKEAPAPKAKKAKGGGAGGGGGE